MANLAPCGLDILGQFWDLMQSQKAERPPSGHKRIRTARPKMEEWLQCPSTVHMRRQRCRALVSIEDPNLYTSRGAGCGHLVVVVTLIHVLQALAQTLTGRWGQMSSSCIAVGTGFVACSRRTSRVGRTMQVTKPPDHCSVRHLIWVTRLGCMKHTQQTSGPGNSYQAHGQSNNEPTINAPPPPPPPHPLPPPAPPPSFFFF